MHWNHRVIKYTLPDGEELYTVREVFYDMADDDEESTAPSAYVNDPSGVQAQDLDGLRKYIGWMLKALDQPVLTPADFGLTDEAALAENKSDQWPADPAG
jgi:hypothetical protein